MEKDAGVHVKDNNGSTPLHEACSVGHLDVIKWLVVEKDTGICWSMTNYMEKMSVF